LREQRYVRSFGDLRSNVTCEAIVASVLIETC
jgi:hypothetical protein